MCGRYLKRRKLFEQEARALLLRLGAVEQAKGQYDWTNFTLATKAGELRLSLSTDLWLLTQPGDWRGGHAPWIACRFADVATAKRVLGSDDRLNPFSGKWNFHHWHNWTDDFAPGLNLLEYYLKKIL